MEMALENTITEFFNFRAPNWDADCSHDSDRLSKIIDVCKIRSNDRVLDIGCGTGVLTPYYLETEASLVMGIDISENMIDVAKGKHSNERVSFSVDSIYNFSKTGWNVAVMFNSFPHLMQRERLVNKLTEILVTGGRFVIAHSESAERINCVHDKKASNISIPLNSAVNESEIFKENFQIDTLIDNSEIYVISGVKY